MGMQSLTRIKVYRDATYFLRKGHVLHGKGTFFDRSVRVFQAKLPCCKVTSVQALEYSGYSSTFAIPVFSDLYETRQGMVEGAKIWLDALQSFWHIPKANGCRD
jgi:hypothetical protein